MKSVSTSCLKLRTADKFAFNPSNTSWKNCCLVKKFEMSPLDLMTPKAATDSKEWPEFVLVQ